MNDATPRAASPASGDEQVDLSGQAPLRVVEEGSTSPSSPRAVADPILTTGPALERSNGGTNPRDKHTPKQRYPKPPLKGRDVTVMPSDGRHSGLPAGLSVPINKIRERAKGAI